MIIINAKLNGENTYDVTVGEASTYRVSAFDLDSAIDLVANHIERHQSKGLYLEHDELCIMAECSRYQTAEAFAKAHNFTRAGTNGIYIEITSVKGCPNG